MIQKINYFLTGVFDAILYPFSFLPEFWGILFLSILMGFVVLFLYKYCSSPTGIKKAKNQIKADILAIRLYKDLGGVIATSFLKSLWHTVKYFGLNFVPILLILPILFPAFVQMDIRYGMNPYQVGDDFMIKAKFNGDITNMDIQLQENEFMKPKMNPVFVKALNEVNWKLKITKTGKTTVKIKANNETYEKEVYIGTTRDALTNRKMRNSEWAHFLYPSEKPLPNSGKIDCITIEYPPKYIQALGITWAWWVLNLILIVIVVLALKNRFGIEF